MRVLAIFPGQLPSPTATNGVPVMSWALVRTLRDAGHEVAICTWGRARSATGCEEARGALAAAGIACTRLSDVRRAPTRGRLHAYATLARQVLQPRLEDFYPEVRFGDDLAALVRRVRPDVLYMYTQAAVARSVGLVDPPPRVAALVDLDHLVLKYRRHYRRPDLRRRRLAAALEGLAERKLPRMIVDMLRPCKLVIEHAANHAEWLREKGLTQTRYLPNPVLDSALELAGGAVVACATPPRKPRFVLLGYLEGTATVAGLHLFADEILPELERLLGPNGFQIDVVGKGDLPPRIAARLARPWVRLMGFVPDVKAVLASCHALLVPTPIELGFRTRICEAFSYGSCVVAHTANRQGMREIAHGENALLSATGVGLARELVRVAEDPALAARLRRGARTTYERELAGARICRTIVSWMEEVATERLRHHAVVDSRRL